jgi:hypothetical protein
VRISCHTLIYIRLSSLGQLLSPDTHVPYHKLDTMVWRAGTYAIWFIPGVAIIIAIAIDLTVFALSVAGLNHSRAIISSWLIIFFSSSIQLLRIFTIEPIANRSFPHIRTLLSFLLVIVTFLNIFFTVSFAYHRHTLFSSLAKLTCFFHAALVEVFVSFLCYGSQN